MAKEFFVSINGNDNNNGSIEKPLLTFLQEAHIPHGRDLEALSWQRIAIAI